MTGLAGADDLYREIILEHHRQPRRRTLPRDATATADGVNSLCGDEVRIGIVVDGVGRIREYGFDGAGCAISQASASLFGDSVVGLDRDEARSVIAAFEELVRGGRAPAVDLGDLAALEGVAKFPMRVKCATLAARTLERALGMTELDR